MYFLLSFAAMSIRASRTNIVLRPDPSRVFFRPFDLMSQERITRIVARVTALERSEAEQEARIMLDRFVERHVKLEGFLLRRFEEVRDHVVTDRPLNDWQKLLVGAYFTLEYSLEAAARVVTSVRRACSTNFLLAHVPDRAVDIEAAPGTTCRTRTPRRWAARPSPSSWSGSRK